MLAIPFCVHRARARAIFFASLFTCPLFISPTRKPRAGLNTRVNPIRCKCFRARPSLVLPVLFPSTPPPAPRPPSLFLSSDFFAERLSRCLLRRLAHGAYIYGRVCARFEASHSRGLHDNVIVSAEGRNKFAGWNVSLSHTYYYSLICHLLFSYSLYSVISVAVLNLFIARLILLWRILLTARAAAEQTSSALF